MKRIVSTVMVLFFACGFPEFCAADRIEDIQNQLKFLLKKLNSLQSELNEEKKERRKISKKLENIKKVKESSAAYSGPEASKVSTYFKGFTIGGDGSMEYRYDKNLDANDVARDRHSYFKDELNFDLNYRYSSIQAHLDMLVSKGTFAGDRENNDKTGDHRWNDGYWVLWTTPMDGLSLKFGDFATNLGKSIVMSEQAATFEVGSRYKNFTFSIDWILRNESNSQTTDEMPNADDRDYDIFVFSGGGDIIPTLYGGFWCILGNDAATNTKFHTLGFALQQVVPTFYQMSWYLEADYSRKEIDGNSLPDDRGYALVAGATIPIKNVTFGTEFAYGSGDNPDTEKDESWLGVSNDFGYDIVWEEEIQQNGLANKMYLKPSFQLSVFPNTNTYLAAIFDWFGREQVHPDDPNKKSLYAGMELDMDNQYIFSNNIIGGIKAGVFIPGDYYDGALNENAFSIVGYFRYKFLTGLR